MKIEGNAVRLLSSGTLLLGATLLASCVHSGGSSDGAFAESEPNDAACCPDSFGFLSAGEFLAIKGTITDNGFDPFDGFSFIAAEPLTVDLRLFAHNPFADLDICVYDPQLGIFIDCFESPFDPEVGTVHVLLPGTEFHVVVNSFLGTSGYTLEVEAFPLSLASAAPPATSPAGDGAVLRAGIDGDEDDKGDRSAAFQPYAEELAASDEGEDAEPFLVEKGTLVELDLETGETRKTSFGMTSEGEWFRMGMPTEGVLEGGL